MADFSQLKAAVANVIKTNGNEEITGAILQDVLLTIINSIAGGYMFGGVAQHSGNVGNPDYNVFYLAGSGSYTGYGGAITIEDGCYGVFRYNGSWTQEVVDIGVRLSGSVTAGETRGCTGDTINTALQTLFDNVMNILDSLTFTYNTPSAQQATKAMLDVTMTPTGGSPHVLTTLTLVSATALQAGLMSAEDKQKVDAFLSNLRSLTFADTTAVGDVGTKITETMSATIGGDVETIATFTLLAATASKAGLMSAADKTYLDSLPAALVSIVNTASDNLAKVLAMIGYYVCDTAAGTAAKTVSASGYVLTNGGCIRVKMTNANTADNVTLNINSTGAKALYYDGEQASATNTWEAGEVLEVYYDGTQYQCASGGGGKFATGEKVKETSIANEVEAGSAALPTSDAVNTAINNGKTFGEKELPIPTIALDFLLSSEGTYTGNTYAHRKIIPIDAGTSIKVVAHATKNSLCAFLTNTDASATSGSSASLTADRNIYNLMAGNTYYLTAPHDAKYFVFNTMTGTHGQNQQDISPRSVSLMLDMAYLNSKIEKDEEPYSESDSAIDVSTFVTKTYNFLSNGKYSGTSGNHNYWLEVSPSSIYTITAGESAINIGWLKSTTAPVTNKYADLSIYNGKVYVLEANATITLEAPQDAVRMICSIVPSAVSVHSEWTYKEQVRKNVDDISVLRADVDKLKVPMNPIAIPSTVYNYWFGSTGYYGGNSGLKHVYIPILPNHTYRIIGGDVTNYAAFLTQSDGSAAVNTRASLTSDGKIYTVLAGATVDMVAPEDARYVVFNTSNGTSAVVAAAFGEMLPLDEYLTAEHDPQTILDFNPSWTIGNLILQAGRNKNLNGSGTSGVKPLVLLHCSDVHSDKKSWDRMIEFYTKYRQYIAGAICTGDLCAQTIDSDKTFLENGGSNIMLTLGNHDVAKTSWNVYDATAQECYEWLFAPYIENWGVTRPDGATYECYYYKDYSTQKIRLIVLDTSIGTNSNEQHWNAAQLAWLQTTLESARTAGYSVVIAQHYWAVNASGRTYVDCTFTCKTPLSEGESIIPADARTAVQSFIDAGGTFICWLSGHTHRDFVYYPTANPKQLGIVVDCMSGFTSGPRSVCDEDRQAGTKSIDAFNIISFDTTRKVIKIVRIGSDTDSLMRHKGVLSIQYGGETPEVIFNN